MSDFRHPDVLSLEGNVSNNWKKWRQKFELYLEASGKSAIPDKTKVAILLNLIGDEPLEIFNTFAFSEPKSCEKLKDVLDKFEDYCAPRKNIVYERFRFFSRSQGEGENFSVFLTAIKKLAATCEFGPQEESLIRDRVVLGVSDRALQERLLRVTDPCLQKTIDYCRAS